MLVKAQLPNNRQGPLAQGLGNGRSAISKIESISILSGTLKISLRNGNAGFKYIENGKEFTTRGEDLLSGIGYACSSESGVLELGLLIEPNLPNPKKWNLRFIKYPENKTLTQVLGEMSNIAKTAAVGSK